MRWRRWNRSAVPGSDHKHAMSQLRDAVFGRIHLERDHVESVSARFGEQSVEHRQMPGVSDAADVLEHEGIRVRFEHKTPILSDKASPHIWLRSRRRLRSA